MKPNKTMLYRFVDGIYLCVHGNHPPTREEWTSYVQDMNIHAEKVRGLLVYVLAHGPDTAQRREVAQVWQRVGAVPPSAIVTTSAINRGIVTALNWFLPNDLTAFRPEQLDTAIRSLKMAPEVEKKVRDTLFQFTKELGVVVKGYENASGVAAQ